MGNDAHLEVVDIFCFEKEIIFHGKMFDIISAHLFVRGRIVEVGVRMDWTGLDHHC